MGPFVCLIWREIMRYFRHPCTSKSFQGFHHEPIRWQQELSPRKEKWLSVTNLLLQIDGNSTTASEKVVSNQIPACTLGSITGWLHQFCENPLMNAVIVPPHTPSTVIRGKERCCSFIGEAVVENTLWNKNNLKIVRLNIAWICQTHYLVLLVVSSQIMTNRNLIIFLLGFV